jgi:hypothetical protein
VDLGELVCHLDGEPLACCRELVLADDAAADRLALQPLHHERLAPCEVRDVLERLRHLHAGAVRSLEDRELVRERERVPVDHAARCPPDEERLAVGVDGPRFLRRAACEQDRLGDLAAECGLERFAHLCDHGWRWQRLSSPT